MSKHFTDIERLRREGPAYTGDEGWELLSPQPLDVVLSIRLDAQTIRSLTALATATNRTPSAMVRDWTLERIAALSSADHSEEPARAIGEAAAGYRVDDEQLVSENEHLRSEYRPERVRWLFVGESSPASGRFFYRANSNLFHATREAFGRGLGPMPAGERFLDEFRRRGSWLVDMADRPVNRERGRPSADAVNAGVDRLMALLRETSPERVIAVKATLEGPVRRAAHLAGISPQRVHVLQFPIRQWRVGYVRDLAAILQADGEGLAESVPPDGRLTLHEAIRRVLDTIGPKAPSRAIANEINRRQLYVRGDGKSLDYQQVLARARKYPKLFEVGSDGVRIR